MIKKWIYLGIFPDSLSKAKNLVALESNNVTIPNDWKRFNHHMTLAFNNGSDECKKLYEFYRKLFGVTTNITIDGIGISEDAIALRVKFTNPIANKIPHITMATPQNGKPVNSNKITNWFDIEPYEIQGTINVFEK